MGFFWRSKRRGEHADEGPSDAADVESLHGEVLTEDVAELYEVDDVEDGFNGLFFISLAVFAVSAIYFTVQRILSNVGSKEKGQHPRKALVLRLPTPKHNLRGLHSPDRNLSFVVPEE